MKKNVKFFMVLFVLPVIAWAATTSGYPSQPKLQALTVSGRVVDGFYSAVRTTDLAVTSSTTATNDPVLQVTLGKAGYYIAKLRMYINLSTTTTQGFKVNMWGGTASFSSPTDAAYTCTLADFGTPGTVKSYSQNNNDATISTAGVNVALDCEMGFSTNAAGQTIVVQEAQAVSSANATTYKAGSRLIVQRVN